MEVMQPVFEELHEWKQLVLFSYHRSGVYIKHLRPFHEKV